MSLSHISPEGSFKTYTYRNADSIHVSSEDEDKFITPYYRTFDDYLFYVDESLDKEYKLKKYVKRLNSESQEFSYLDCGAGNGTAIQTFLQGYGDSTSIKCHGISLHLFNNVKSLIKEYPKQIAWHHGDALAVLKKFPSNSFDLITDIWGAYFYSKDFSEIIQEYYRILKPKGRCYIKSGDGKLSAIGREKFQNLRYERFLQEKAPRAFYLSNETEGRNSIVMEKLTLRWPISTGLQVKKNSHDYIRRKKKRTHQEMIDGCAVYPTRIRIEEVPSKRANLRQMPIPGSSS